MAILSTLGADGYEVSLIQDSPVVVTTNTSAVTGNFRAIQVLEDATFSVFTESGASGQAMTGFAVQAGITLFGHITAYTLTSGKVRAYKA